MAVQTKSQPKSAHFAPGDSVRVSARVVEGERERLQTFEGVVLRMRRSSGAVAFTVRRVTHGVGVERTFLLDSPRVERVEVRRKGRVRRAKLYYLRGRTGRAARIREAGRLTLSEEERLGVSAAETEEEAPAEAEVEEVLAEDEAGSEAAASEAEAEPVEASTEEPAPAGEAEAGEAEEEKQ